MYCSEKLDQVVVPARQQRVANAEQLLRQLYPDHDELVDYLC